MGFNSGFKGLIQTNIKLTQTYCWIKFIEVPPFILHVVTRVKEKLVFDTKRSSPCGVCPVQRCTVCWCLHDDGDLSLEHVRELMCMGDTRFYAVWICSCMWAIIVTKHGMTNTESIITYLWGYLRTGCWGEYLGLRGTKWQGSGGNYIIRSWMICTPDPLFLG